MKEMIDQTIYMFVSEELNRIAMLIRARSDEFQSSLTIWNVASPCRTQITRNLLCGISGTLSIEIFNIRYFQLNSQRQRVPSPFL